MTDQAKEVVDEAKQAIRYARRLERQKWSRRRLKELILLVLTAYFAIWMHTLYLNQCIQQSYLSETRATICKYSFYPWSGKIEPGVQVSNRAPASGHNH